MSRIRRELATMDGEHEERHLGGSRRVEYVVLVPGEQHQWLLVAFSRADEGDPGDGLADVLVELFDALMTTLRWGHPPAT